ncbi:hypothetical protein [Carboxylicivirga sp. RSCT41]|uniref:hypothetical protein n=1 Tax=Carboxylicivirga agarovorans TaxID=3417570 RepID=UPI003D331BD7
MNNYDLIPNTDTIETLFIMESPYKEEIRVGLPCVGESGKVMSYKILDGDSSLAFGYYLNNQKGKTCKFGIMNTFNFPIDREVCGENQFSVLKDVPYTKYTNRIQHYNDLFSKLNELTDGKRIEESYQRLIGYLQNSPTIKNIVICGYIAQSVYVHNFNKKNDIPRYNTQTNEVCPSGRELNILFVNHPSPKNGKWIFQLNNLK